MGISASTSKRPKYKLFRKSKRKEVVETAKSQTGRPSDQASQNPDSAKEGQEHGKDVLCQPLGSYFHAHDSFKAPQPNGNTRDPAAQRPPRSKLGPKLNAKTVSGAQGPARQVPKTPFQDQEVLEITEIKSDGSAVASHQSARESQSRRLVATLSRSNLRVAVSTGAPTNHFSKGNVSWDVASDSGVENRLDRQNIRPRNEQADNLSTRGTSSTSDLFGSKGTRSPSLKCRHPSPPLRASREFRLSPTPSQHSSPPTTPSRRSLFQRALRKDVSPPTSRSLGITATSGSKAGSAEQEDSPPRRPKPITSKLSPPPLRTSGVLYQPPQNRSASTGRTSRRLEQLPEQLSESESIRMGRASPLPLRASTAFTTTGERESIPLPAEPSGSSAGDGRAIPDSAMGRMPRKWPGGGASDSEAETRQGGSEAWRPPPIQISIRPEEAVEYEKVPISRSRRQGASMETAVASSSEGVGGGQVPHTQAGSTSTAPSRDVTFEEKGAAKVAPIEAAVPPMEEVHKLNFVGKMTQLTGMDKYEELGFLGESRAGKTKLMRDRMSLELVAAKWVEHKAMDALSKETEREICNHRRLRHPGIIGFKEVFSTDDSLVIVMEHAAGGQLDAWVTANGRFTEARARSVFIQIANAVAFCHRRGIVHRNLRADNIFVTGSAYQPIVKISGFGYSKDLAMDSIAITTVAMPAYQPPELLVAVRNELLAGMSATASDCWSLGVILFYMLTAKHPFWGEENAGTLNRRVMRNIASASYRFPADVDISPECLDFVSRVLVADPNERLTAEEMMQHPWLAGKMLPGTQTMGESLQSVGDIKEVMERTRRRHQAAKTHKLASSKED